MSETHPNAFKAEADEKRRQAAALLTEADVLDPREEVSTEEPGEVKKDRKVKK